MKKLTREKVKIRDGKEDLAGVKKINKNLNII